MAQADFEYKVSKKPHALEQARLPIGAARLEKETTENNLKLAKDWQKNNRYQKQQDEKKKEQIRLDVQKGVIEKRENKTKARSIRNKLIRQEKSLHDEQIAWYQRQILADQRNALLNQKLLVQKRSFRTWRQPYKILLCFKILFFMVEIVSSVLVNEVIMRLPWDTESILKYTPSSILEKLQVNDLNDVGVEETRHGQENWVISDSRLIISGSKNSQIDLILSSISCALSLGCIISIFFNIYSKQNYPIPPMITLYCFLQNAIVNGFMFVMFIKRCQKGRCYVIPTLYAIVIFGFMDLMLSVFGSAIPFNHMMILAHPPFFFANVPTLILEDGQCEDMYQIENRVNNCTKYTEVPLLDKEQKYQRKLTLLEDFHEEVVHEGKQDEIKAEKKRKKKKK